MRLGSQFFSMLCPVAPDTLREGLTQDVSLRSQLT